MNAIIEWENEQQASAAGWLYDSVRWPAEGESEDESAATGTAVLSGAAQGATAGAALGPFGALVGGALGAVSSGLGGGRRRSRRRGRSQAPPPQVAAGQAPVAGAEPAPAAVAAPVGCEMLARQVERLIPLLAALAYQRSSVPSAPPAIARSPMSEPEPADPLAGLAGATTAGESEAVDYLESFTHPAFQSEDADDEQWIEASGEELDEDFEEHCCGDGQGEDAEAILPACFAQAQPASSI